VAITRFFFFFFFASSLFLGSRRFTFLLCCCVTAFLPLRGFAPFCSLVVVVVLNNCVMRFLRAFVDLRRVLLSVGFLALFAGVCVPLSIFLLYAALLPCQRVEVVWRFLKNDNGDSALRF
jgi:hypothetical protein